MTKKITMDYGEYKDDLTQANCQGYMEAMKEIDKCFNDIKFLKERALDCEDDSVSKVYNKIFDYHTFMKELGAKNG